MGVCCSEDSDSSAMLQLSDTKVSHISDNGSTLTLCSYNILAECYCFAHYFPYAAESTLKWPSRYKLLIEQLTAFSADCLMLQEVDHSEEICSALREIGYESAFAPRSNGRKDGCVLAWKKAKLQLVARIQVVDFNFFAEFVRDDCQKERFVRDNIGVMALLRLRATGQLVLLCTAHIHWNPALSDVKLFQMAAMLNSIEWFKAKSEETDKVHVVFGGDFNSLPENAGYELAVTGAVKRKAAFVDELAGVSKETVAETCEIATDESDEISSKLKVERHLFHTPKKVLSSTTLADASDSSLVVGVPLVTVNPAEACAQLLTVSRPSEACHSLALDSCLKAAFGSEPPLTTYTEGFKGCLDYVFVSADNCRVVSAEKLPTGDSLPNFLPDSKNPSDHLPLRATIELL